MNTLYDLGKKALLDADIDMLVDTIKVRPVDSTYVPNYSTDQYLSDVSGFVAAGVTLTGKATTAGRFTADDTTFTSLTGSAVHYLLLYHDTGVAGTSQLIALLDTLVGLPFTPIGTDLLIAWDPNGIFKI